MIRYGMYLKNGFDLVHLTQQETLEEATKYFAERKKMSIQEFKKIFVVKELTDKNENYGIKKRF